MTMHPIPFIILFQFGMIIAASHWHVHTPSRSTSTIVTPPSHYFGCSVSQSNQPTLALSPNEPRSTAPRKTSYLSTSDPQKRHLNRERRNLISYPRTETCSICHHFEDSRIRTTYSIDDGNERMTQQEHHLDSSESHDSQQIMNSFLNVIYGVCIIVIVVTTTIKAFSIIHISSLSILALLASFPHSTNAAFYQKLIGDDHPIGGQYFGRGTAMGDNITFVGARGANSWQGAVYVFAKNTTTESWQQKQKLIPSDSGEIGFGLPLDFDEANRVLIVGGPWRNAYQGSAYIFNEDINGYWQQSQLLVPPGAGASDYCGTSVSIENNVAVVGCHGDDDVIRDGGAVNIYEYDGYNWAFAAKIVIPDPASTGEYFGVSTDISNGVIVVGANGYGASEGAAYIIEKEGTWGITHALHPPFVITGLSFGYDVCIDGDTIAISATFSTGAGRVYLYTRDEQNALNKTDEIQASDVEEEEENRRFGGSMSLYNNTLVVGSPYDNDHAYHAGSFYIFERVEGSWTPITKLMPDVSSVALLGYENSLTVYKNSIVVGAPLDDTGGTVSGSAFIYERYGSGFEWIPTEAPSNAPSQPPTQPPSSAPSDAPSQPPSSAPSQAPSDAPSQSPTQPPSRAPSQSPTQPPSSAPSDAPSQPPSSAPSQAPSDAPSQSPTQPPSRAPSQSPTQPPSSAPSQPPSTAPSVAPTESPTTC
eukprot:1044861_1